MPNIDDALDEEGAKREFWAAFRVLGPVVGGPAALLIAAGRTPAVRLGPMDLEEKRLDQIADRCEECGAKLTTAEHAGGARVRRPGPVLDPRGRGRARTRAEEDAGSARRVTRRAQAGAQLAISSTILPSLPPLGEPVVGLGGLAPAGRSRRSAP